MSIDTFSFIKNDNIGEVRESLEKFMQLKLTGKIEAASWTAISLPDSTQLAMAGSHSLSKNIAAGSNSSSEGSLKKKDESAIDPNTYDKIASHTSTSPTRQTGKRPIKDKEQVSFGPAY